MIRNTRGIPEAGLTATTSLAFDFVSQLGYWSWCQQVQCEVNQFNGFSFPDDRLFKNKVYTIFPKKYS